MRRSADGLRLALTTFTVLPVRTGRVNRASAGTAMSLAPLVGGALGALLGGVALLLRLLGAPTGLCAVGVLAAGVFATRALHLDGLADTVDALGSYAGRERALEIMKRSDLGPFGAVALLLVLAGQGTALAAIAERPPVPLLATMIVAAGTGRLSVTLACRRRIPAARPDGLGALAAGTVAAAVPAACATLLAIVGTLAVPHRWWAGAVAVATGAAASELLTRHAVRRLGGITGDVLGAGVEIATTLSLAVLALG